MYIIMSITILQKEGEEDEKVNGPAYLLYQVPPHLFSIAEEKYQCNSVKRWEDPGNDALSIIHV